MRVIKLFIASFFLISCNNEISQKNIEVKIIMEVKVRKDDKFQLFYSNSFFESYNEKQSSIVKVIGRDDFQEVELKIMKGFIPKRIRIDLGDNQQQSPIIINKITITNNNISKIYEGSEILEMFEFNEYIVYDNQNHSATLLKNEKNYDPYLISKNLDSVFQEILN
ncbi:hypothetical protein [Flavobacterium microcysteis]|uniref:Lipoprotein n=1 Tax=Flavobacterium microcysteis TaxID=2596891 RepID=A0A501QIH1_9FLAO|nr:hypothetical protein [Flavobacterium microcysteis]TPD71955.1 hypothetical protein FJA49_03475 [Flavobacterium microcysteis]